MYNHVSRPRVDMEALPQSPDMSLDHTADTLLRLSPPQTRQPEKQEGTAGMLSGIRESTKNTTNVQLTESRRTN
jgi:hypothetical protein